MEKVEIGKACGGRSIALKDRPSDFPGENEEVRINIYETRNGVLGAAGAFSAYIEDGKMNVNEYSFTPYAPDLFEKLSNSHVRYGSI